MAAFVAYRVLENSMSAVFGRRAKRCAVLAWALTAVAAFGAAPARADTVTVSIDRARVMKLPERVATIVIGNPLIADATLQNGGILVVTGKGYGETNLLALDRKGRVVMSKTVQVLGPESRQSGRRLSRRQARNLQLRAAMRAAHHARRRADLFHADSGADRRAQRAGQGQHGIRAGTNGRARRRIR